MIFPSFEVYNEDYLCISKEVKDVGAGLLLKSYTFVDGDAVGGWIDFFKKWLETGQDFVLRESEEVLQQLRSRERVDWDGNISVLVYNYLFPSDTLFPSKTLFPGSYETAVVYQEG